jgi:hypothetical protein
VFDIPVEAGALTYKSPARPARSGMIVAMGSHPARPVLAAALIQRVHRASGRLTRQAAEQLQAELPWYAQLSADDRAWVGLVLQAGITAFTDWLRAPLTVPRITGEVFGSAPRELTRSVTLAQTVEIVRLAVDVVEQAVDELASPEECPLLREAVLRYSRELAYAAADVYARAAEERGAWDARLQALVVDGVLRGEADDALLSRAGALGWGSPGRVAVLVGSAPDAEPEGVLDAVRRGARRAGADVLAGVAGHRLIAILGANAELAGPAGAVVDAFAPGPVVLGPPVAGLTQAHGSARTALTSLRAAAAWPEAPRPVPAAALLAERAVAGDESARGRLEQVYSGLTAAGPEVLPTLAAYLESAASLQGAARRLFVHPNTVRYRLRKVAEVSGYDPARPRDRYSLWLALTLGRLAAHDSHL